MCNLDLLSWDAKISMMLLITMLPFQWWLQRWFGRWSTRCAAWSIDYNDYNDYDDDLKDNGEGDPQDAHLGRAAEVQDEDWDKTQSSASSKRGGYHEDFSKIISPNVVVITIKNNNECNIWCRTKKGKMDKHRSLQWLLSSDKVRWVVFTNFSNKQWAGHLF